VIYWRADREGFDTADLQGDATTTLADTDAGGTNAAETPRTSENTESGRTHGESNALAVRVWGYIARKDVPPKTEHGRNAVIDVFRYLREHGTAKTGELQDAVYPDYADEWGSPRSMWESIKRGFGDTPGIEKGGYGEWTYTDDESVREETSA